MRTGRAIAALLDHVRVDYYGTPTPLNQVATVSVPDARTLVIQPWDKSADRADREGHPEVRPRPHPDQRRQADPPADPAARPRSAASSSSSVGKLAEEARVAIRNVRRDANDKLKALAQGQEDLRGRRAARATTESRSSPTGSSPEGRRAPEEEGAGDPGVLTADSTGSAADAVAADEAALLDSVRQQPLPRHVAVIMDGNGRWADHRGLPRVAGHREGVAARRARRSRAAAARRHRVPDALRVLDRELDAGRRPR